MMTSLTTLDVVGAVAGSTGLGFILVFLYCRPWK